MICLIISLFFIVTGMKEDNLGAYLFAGILIIAGFSEYFLEKKFWNAITRNSKENKELRDLENQVKKEKLKKELEELKRQNAE